MLSKSNEELYRKQASKSRMNVSSNEISNEERHSRNAHESAIEQNYPRIDTENL